ncbi:MAG: hypothetical protein ACOZAA_01255 [Pseudomonadota bacterium]
MDEQSFKESVNRLEQVGKVLEKLPVEVRSEAFNLLKDYVFKPREHRSEAAKRASTQAPDDGAFFEKFSHDQPADNAKLIAAYFFREYGSAPFSIDDVRKTADDVGITIPSRVDMTFISAVDGGKKLFTRAGRGKFKPTVHGEANLKTTYSIKKGTKRRPEESE